MADQNPLPEPKTTSSTDRDERSPLPRDATPTARLRRPVYEPTLLPTRKRRRASPWLVIPSLLLILGAILYVVLVLPRQRRFVPTVGQIVFASDQGTPGHPHLWLAGPDGAGAHRLTASPADETSPAWSPDGAQIAYLSAKPGGEPQIVASDADGRNVAPVTQNAGAKSQPQFAPSDNSLLGYLSGGAFSTADISTGQTTRLLPAATDSSHPQNTDAAGGTGQNATITSFAWSPAKDRTQQGLAAVEDVGGAQALILMPTLGDKPRDTRNDPSGSSVPLAAAETVTLGWSPDAGLLAVALWNVQGLPAGRHMSLLALLDGQGNPSGPRPIALFPSSGIGPEHPVFSPDGTQVVGEFWQGADLAHQQSAGLFIVSIDGSTPPRPLYRGSGTDVHFSGDGRTLYFLHSRPGGGHDLCRIGVDGTGFTRISDGHSDVSAVSVSPQEAGHS